jgi:hypothetical protein
MEVWCATAIDRKAVYVTTLTVKPPNCMNIMERIQCRYTELPVSVLPVPLPQN